MVRISVDLLNASLSYLNPVKERELNLRGNKIPLIENLGSAAIFEALDLTDNDIPSIGGFPSMPHLHTILLARNRVTSFNQGVEESIPALTTLVLEHNRLELLADLDTISHFLRLEHLVLLGNPVTKKENYRAYIIHRAPQLRYLDYQKVNDGDRKKAKQLFGTVDEPSDLALSVSKNKTKTNDMFEAFNPTISGKKTPGSGLTAEEKKRWKRKIESASSLEEAAKMEAEMRTQDI